MDGTNKYSPPLGTTHVCSPRSSDAAVLPGSAPVMARSPTLPVSSTTCPISGSKPGCCDLSVGKSWLLAQAVCLIVRINQSIDVVVVKGAAEWQGVGGGGGA